MGGAVIGIGGDVSIGGSVIGVSGSMTGEAGAPMMGQSCNDPSECDVSSACVEATCNSNQCGEKNLPDGPFKLQVPGDCKQAMCKGGKETLEVDVNDKDDKVECTTDSCGPDGQPMHTPRVGAACGNGGLCGPNGGCANCGPCEVADACHVNYCAATVCKQAPKPVGTLCPGPNGAGSDQCNAQGTCVDCTDNGGCTEVQVCNVDQHTCVPDSP